MHCYNLICSCFRFYNSFCTNSVFIKLHFIHLLIFMKDGMILHTTRWSLVIIMNHQTEIRRSIEKIEALNLTTFLPPPLLLTLAVYHITTCWAPVALLAKYLIAHLPKKKKSSGQLALKTKWVIKTDKMTIKIVNDKTEPPNLALPV